MIIEPSVPKLEEAWHLQTSTIVIFMTDNVSQQRRYVAWLKDSRGCVARWSQSTLFIRLSLAAIQEIEKSKRLLHTLMWMPTLAELLADLKVPKDRKNRWSLACFHWFREMRIQDRSKLFLSYWISEYPEPIWNISIQRSGWETPLGRQVSILILRNLNFTMRRRSPMSFRILLLSGKTLKALELKIRIRWKFCIELTQERNYLNPSLW